MIAVGVTRAAPLANSSILSLDADNLLRAWTVSVVGEADTVTKIVDTELHAESFLGLQSQCQFVPGRSHNTSHRAVRLNEETGKGRYGPMD